MSAPLNPDARPRPLWDAFRTVAAARATLGGILTALAGWGLLTATQLDAITALLGAAPGVVALATALLAAFGVVKHAEPKVTPTDSPAIEVDGQLVALVPDAGRHSLGQ